jgi:hypothetical protein
MKRLCCIVLIVFVNALFVDAQSPRLYFDTNLDVTDCKIIMIFARFYENSPESRREKAAKQDQIERRSCMFVFLRLRGKEFGV